METQANEEVARIRQIADEMGFLTEQDFRALAGASPVTVEAWRKRGKGPAYVRLGRNYFYPRAAVQKFLENSVRCIEPRGGALL